MNGLQIINVALVWWLLGLGHARPEARARLSAFKVFAWNPLMLFDAAGQRLANDALYGHPGLTGIAPLPHAQAC